MSDDIKSRVPGQYWGEAGNALPKASPEARPACVVLDVPFVGRVRFTMKPWSYHTHRDETWAWKVVRAQLAPSGKGSSAR